MNVIKEVSMSVGTTIEEMSSDSIDMKLNAIEQTMQQDNSNEYSNKSSLEYESLYNAIMEWILKKSPLPIDVPLSIDDTDKIHFSINILKPLYNYCSESMKIKIVKDLFTLTKWNQSNCVALLKSNHLYFWILDILMENQILLLHSNLKGFSFGV